MTETIRLATRGSDLALRQARRVAETLESRRRDVELIEVETTGDAVRDELIHRLGKTGAFVRSLDEKVLDGEVDAAVHSMKDMPTEFPAKLVVAGVPERAAPGDVLVTPEGVDLSGLPDGATIGTSSLRRKAPTSTCGRSAATSTRGSRSSSRRGFGPSGSDGSKPTSATTRRTAPRTNARPRRGARRSRTSNDAR